MGNNTSSSSDSRVASSATAAATAAAAAAHETKKQAKSHHHKHASSITNKSTRDQMINTTTLLVTEPSPSQQQQSSSSSTSTSSKPTSPAVTSTPLPPPIPQQDIPSRPVPIFAGPTILEPASARSHSHRSSLENSSNPPAIDMSYHLTRPPRLPLPIEEEVHTPGSPIIPPADADAPPLDLELDHIEHAELARKDSQSTDTTGDEEDEDAELQLDNTKAVVPTTVEWIGGTEKTKVYVTGSIFSWNKKQRLHADPNRPGVFSALIHVRPGTHHLNFLIDSVMTTSTHLPTTVDFNNHLVNYIEVSPDDIPKPAAVPATSKPTSPSTSKPPPTPKMKPTIPLSSYTSAIPGYLEDLDLPEDSERYQRAAAAIEKLPPPPSLPGFLGKPILNAATPMKDDNSVLVFPNHTVLNHLATSSIKNSVLAVSATTRYKKKYVTTIMYKPT